MCGGSGGGGNGGRSGGGGGSTNGDAGQPGEVVREANKANEKARLEKIIERNIATGKARQSGLNALRAEKAKIESAGQFNYGKRDFAVWKPLNDAAIKGSQDQAKLKARTKNILERYKKL